MYRLEKVIEYKNCHFVFETIDVSFDIDELTKQLHSLSELPHYGTYQIIKSEVLKTEHTRRDSVEGYKIKS